MGTIESRIMGLLKLNLNVNKIVMLSAYLYSLKMICLKNASLLLKMGTYHSMTNVQKNRPINFELHNLIGRQAMLLVLTQISCIKNHWAILRYTLVSPHLYYGHVSNWKFEFSSRTDVKWVSTFQNILSAL